MEAEEVQKLIDHEILALKTRRNTYSRISRLPNELFLHIFAILQKDRYDLYTDITEWHHIMHVCRHWRHIALESAILWIHPPTHRHDYTLLMLERSRTSALDIEMDRKTSEATCIAVLDHIERVKSLIIEHSEPVLQLFQHYLQALGKSAPLLEKFEINLDYQSQTTRGSFRLSDTTIDRFPSLKSLSLYFLDFNWGILPLENKLTSFTLVGVQLLTPPSWAQFYDALRQMHSLTDLCLKFEDLLLVSPPPRAEPLHLPHLHSLFIHESRASVVEPFITNSSFPQLWHGYFECSFDEDSDPDELSATIRAIVGLLSRGSFCLDDLVVGNDTFNLNRLSDADSDLDAEQRHRLILTVMEWAHSRRKMKVAQELMTALAALPPKFTAQFSQLNLSAKLSTNRILQLFGSLPGLDTIIGWEASSSDLIQCLRLAPNHLENTQPPFALVRSVVLHGPRKLKPGYMARFKVEDLLECLVERSQHGIGVAYLYIDWPLDDDELRRLQEVVAEVEIV